MNILRRVRALFWNGPGPAFAAVGDMPPGWDRCEVIDLDTMKPLEYRGRPAMTTACSAKEGWVDVNDYDSDDGRYSIDKYGEILKVRIHGHFEIHRLP